MVIENFIQGCRRIGGRLMFNNTICEAPIKFKNTKGENVTRIVQVQESRLGRGGFVVTEGSAWDSGFDTHIFIEQFEPASDIKTLKAFDFASDIIKAEGHPEKMQDIFESLSDSGVFILDPSEPDDKKILEDL